MEKTPEELFFKWKLLIRSETCHLNKRKKYEIHIHQNKTTNTKNPNNYIGDL